MIVSVIELKEQARVKRRMIDGPFLVYVIQCAYETTDYENKTTYYGVYVTVMVIADERLYDKVLELAIAHGLSATDVHRELLASEGEDIPHLRTIQRWVREMTRRNDSAEWSIGESDILEAREVIPVLEAIIIRSRGEIRTVTQAEARWIGLVAASAPGLDKWRVWVVARLYQMREHQGAGFDDLDAFLAFTPWIDDQAYENYSKAIALDLVSVIPMAHYLVGLR